MHNVLIYPCESEVGVELVRALRSSVLFRLHGCSADSGRGAPLFERHHGNLPELESPSFLAELSEIVRDHSIDIIYPASDEAISHLSACASDGLLEASVIAPSPDVGQVCLSHAATYAYFAGKLPVPRQLKFEELGEADYPVYVKGEDGNGMGGVIAEDRLQAEDALRRLPLATIFEHLPGTEYTVDCFTDRTGALLFVSGRERRKVLNNQCTDSLLVANPRFRTFADTINIELKMRGGWYFQVKEDRDGRMRLIEVRSRVSFSSSLQRALGVNLPHLTLLDRVGGETRIITNGMRAARVERSMCSRFRLDLDYDTAYIDLDNTVIIRNQVNLDAVRFIFQCRNRGIRVVLLARSVRPPQAILAKYRLDGVVDEAIWMRGCEGKSTVITATRAIFVDDSPAERHEVRANLGIPVFDPSGIEALLMPS